MDPLSTLPNLIERVHLRLVDAIADGSLAPNERLTQEEIAQQLSVSRQPVSHALQLLKRQGLVVEHGKRGLTVAPGRAALDPEPLPGACRARRAGRAPVGREDFGGHGRAPVRSMVSARRSPPAALLGDDAGVHEWIEADVAFHSSIYALSGNPAIAETVADRWPHFKRWHGGGARQPRLAEIGVGRARRDHRADPRRRCRRRASGRGATTRRTREPGSLPSSPRRSVRMSACVDPGEIVLTRTGVWR